LIAFNCFGLATSYLIIQGDLYPQVVEFFKKDAGDYYYGLPTNRHVWTTIIGFAMGLPLMSFRTWTP